MTEAYSKEFFRTFYTYSIKSNLLKRIIAMVESEKPLKSRNISLFTYFIMRVSKLSIEDLMVDSYAVQLSDQELTQIKGGTTVPCGAYVLIGTMVTVIGTIIVAGINKQKTVKKKIQTVNKLKNVKGGDSTITTTEYHYVPIF